jgi:hypothetical protein
LSDGKSLDYKKQLSSELSSSLYRPDGAVQSGGTLGPGAGNGWALPLSGPPAPSNDLELSGLLFHPQFANLTQSMVGGVSNSVGAPTNAIYQGVYATQVRLWLCVCKRNLGNRGCLKGIRNVAVSLDYSAKSNK